jgi:hypothetical protein
VRKFFETPLALPMCLLPTAALIGGAILLYEPPGPELHGEVVSKRHIYESGRPAHRTPECYRLDLQVDPEKDPRGLCVSLTTFQQVQIGDLYTEAKGDRRV